jgi:hypothetical protein
MERVEWKALQSYTQIWMCKTMSFIAVDPLQLIQLYFFTQFKICGVCEI